MVDALVSWPSFVAAVAVFGFAPRAVLRVILLAFNHDDPRRAELLGELNAVPRFERPFWVLEQLEVALVEGLGERIRWTLTGRVIHRWHLESGVDRHQLYPDTFWIPDEADRAALEPGMFAKLMFEMNDGFGERMWVEITHVKKRHLVGQLCNRPAGIPRLMDGDTITFGREHVIDIDAQPEPDGSQS